MNTLLVVQVLAVVLASIALSFPLAQALVLPGKLKLNSSDYLATHGICRRGLFYGLLIGEMGGLAAAVAHLVLTPFGTASFWLTTLAIAGFFCMQMIFWIAIRPVHHIWSRNQEIRELPVELFHMNAAGETLDRQPLPSNWKELRIRCEYSQAFRAAFALVSLIAIAVAAIA